jgi:hypothetical protein
LNSLRLSNFNCRNIITVSRYQYRMRNSSFCRMHDEIGG